MYEKIPQELKEYSNWCLYRLVKRDGKNTKIPINGLTGEFAKSNDKSTWNTYEICVDNIDKFGCNGIGFFFDEPFFGIDIDKIDEDVELFKQGIDENIINEFADSLKTYGEFSQSGKGVHFICKGKLPEGGRRKSNVEMYSSGRFFVMTGNSLSNIDYVNECTEEVIDLFEKYIGSSEIEKNSPNFNSNLELDEILDVALKNKKFHNLFINNHTYSSQSEADMAFCNYLAYYCAKDKEKMDAIFRQSSLYRTKWDEKRGEFTYGEKTLNKAIKDCKNVYLKDDEFKIFIGDNTFFSYDDTGNAERFLKKYEDIVRYNYDNKSFMIYNSRFWQEDSSSIIKNLAETVIADMKNEFKFVNDEDQEKALLKHIKYTRNSKGKENMLKELQHKVAITNNELDLDPYLFNVDNGFLDLKEYLFKDHDKNNFFSKIAGTEFDPKRKCPKWIKFLREIFLEDEELIEFIQKAIGYSLTGSTREQCLFILFGNGLNGKSVFLEVMSALFGHYALNIQPGSLMVKNQQGANNDIARLKGARFVTTTEPNDGMRFDEGLVKQLTGGDKVTARFLYKNEFEFIPEFKIWMATNHKPIIRGNDDGIWRRLNIIPFDAKVKKINKNLKEELLEELPGILNWALAGLKKYHKDGLEKPEKVKNSISLYKQEMDTIGQFIDECIMNLEGYKVGASVVYQTYKNWAIMNGQYVMSGTKFGIEFSKKFEKVSMKGKKFYKNVTVRNLEQEVVKVDGLGRESKIE